jgi:putative NIF3 family GTP cyclohydrolase 1 type 2
VDLETFAARVRDTFVVEQFDERGGWVFALAPEEIADLERVATAEFRSGWNGLLCAPDLNQPVTRVYLLVFPEFGLIEQVLADERERGNPGAVIVTHHPCDMETAGRGFVAIPSEQLAALTEARVALYVLHAPLDCHETISTSGALADGLGLTRVGTFAPYYASNAGVLAEQEPEPFNEFARRVKHLCEIPDFDPRQVRFSGRPVRKVAILAGGGDDLDSLAEAERWGADTFLAGHWWTPHPGEWCDSNREAIRELIAGSRMNLLGASHDGSELVVFRDRLGPLFKSWGLDVALRRQADHWR